MVRDKVKEKILHKKVTVHCGKFDKYGRLLIDLICIEDQCHINKWLLENDLAIEYFGGRKENKFCDVMYYMNLINELYKEKIQYELEWLEKYNKACEEERMKKMKNLIILILFF